MNTNNSNDNNKIHGSTKVLTEPNGLYLIKNNVINKLQKKANTNGNLIESNNIRKTDNLTENNTRNFTRKYYNYDLDLNTLLDLN